MDVRVGIFFLLLLGSGWATAARQITATEISTEHIVLSDVSVMKIKHQEQALEDVTGNNQVCTLCEEFTAQAIDYLSANKTQTEVIENLHKACSRVSGFKQECITLVDYYAPLFFLEVSTVQPEDFCKKVNLCEKVAVFASQLREDSCAICHHAIEEVLVKLKDPDTKLEIIELLLKACNSMPKNSAKCKKMVFEYGPVILTNAEQFLETTDVCTMLHACTSPSASVNQAATSLKADS